MTDDVGKLVERAYDDAISAAVNPFLHEILKDGEGPWELQQRIKQAIEFHKEKALAALPAVDSRLQPVPDAQKIIDLVVERAEQACRYALKHQNFERSENKEYVKGWEDAASVCEQAIKEHVARHIAGDLVRAVTDE